MTVERIFGEPNLNGRLYRGVLWAPNDHQLSFLDTKGIGSNAKTELWVMDSATEVRSMLVSAEKLADLLPPASAQQSETTGMERHRPPYQWAPEATHSSLPGLTT